MTVVARYPDSTKTSLEQRLRARARERWPQIASLQIRHRGVFSYVDATLTDATTLKLCRLRYVGSASQWQFAIYRASHDDYDESVFFTGLPIGTCQDALDTACGLYLNDPTAWTRPPTNLRPRPLSFRRCRHSGREAARGACIHIQGRLQSERPAKPLKPRRDLGVIHVRIVTAAGADELEHVGVAAFDAAVHEVDRPTPHERRPAMAGLPGKRECHPDHRPHAQPRVRAIVRTRGRERRRDGQRVRRRSVSGSLGLLTQLTARAVVVPAAAEVWSNDAVVNGRYYLGVTPDIVQTILRA